MNWSKQSNQTSFYLQMMDKRVKNDDILRIINEKVDFSFINRRCKSLYSDCGPNGYSPERLFRMLIIMYLENIRSERRLVKELNVNIRYMWFCRIDLDSDVPDHSTFTVLRSRLGDQVFKEIFEHIVQQMIDRDVIQPKSISVDSTSVLADVKAPQKNDKNVASNGRQNISPHDPDARYGHTSVRKKFFGYKAQIMTDNDNGAILNIDVQPGNTDDKALDQTFMTSPLKEHDLKVREAALDRGFDSYAIRHVFQKQKIKTAIPLRKHNTHGVYSAEAFTIDLKNRGVLCPAQRPMQYRGFNSGKKHYEFIGTGCQECVLKDQCTTGPARRIVVHQSFMLKQSARKFNQTSAYKKIFKKRSCVERVIGEAKRFHGLIRAKFRCRWKVRIQSFLTATAINLKRIAAYYIKTRIIRLAGP